MIDPWYIADYITEDVDIFNQDAVILEEEFDPEEIKMGIETELEHTKDKKVAKKIALDHLRENPKYYSILKKCMPGEVK